MEDCFLQPIIFSGLRSDPTVMCVSAWNDNGSLVDPNSRTIHRTDVFPGLGWMVTMDFLKSVLVPKWPDRFWDEWLRTPAMREYGVCLRPEVSRILHRHTGASHGEVQLLKQVTTIRTRNKWPLKTSNKSRSKQGLL